LFAFLITSPPILAADTDPLARFAGDWGVQQTLATEPATGKAVTDVDVSNLTVSTSITSGGNLLILRASGPLDLQGKRQIYSGAGVLSFDQGTKTYTELWNDNQGKSAVLSTTDYEVSGDGNTLRLKYKINGADYVSQYKADGSRALEYTLFQSSGGSSSIVKQTTFIRK
jgi:hypothetical protein